MEEEEEKEQESDGTCTTLREELPAEARTDGASWSVLLHLRENL